MKLKQSLMSGAVALALAGCGGWFGNDDAASAGGQQPAAQAGKGGAAAGAQQPQSASAMSTQYGAETIKEVQQALNEKGYDAGPVDGNWGPLTQGAVKNFQIVQKMDASGELNQETLSALGVEQQSASGGSTQKESASAGASAGAAGGASAGATASPDVIRQVENQLDQLGYDVGDKDGKMDEQLRAALTKYQKEQNLPGSGELNHETFSALGVEPAASTGGGRAKQ